VKEKETVVKQIDKDLKVNTSDQRKQQAAIDKLTKELAKDRSGADKQRLLQIRYVCVSFIARVAFRCQAGSITLARVGQSSLAT
jgi:hypothetical protein